MFGSPKSPLDKFWEGLLEHPIVRLAVGLLLGLVFTIWGASIYLKGRDLAKEGVETEGTVVSVRMTRTQKATHHFPTLEFKDAQGNVHQVETGEFNCKEGDKLDVLYMPNNPKRAEIKNSAAGSTFQYCFMLVVGAIGWAAVLYNIYFMVRYKHVW